MKIIHQIMIIILDIMVFTSVSFELQRQWYKIIFFSQFAVI